MKLLFVLGTRPEAIKLASLIRMAKKDSRFDVRVVSTGQHREMLKPVLKLFDIVPDNDFDLMTPGQSLNQLTCSILEKLRMVITSDRPDWLIVQGDTTTTMASSLCGFYEKISIAHVEAGLRTRDIFSPFPEELNRRVTGLVAQLHFPPTPESQNHLLSEGTPADQIKVVGNTGIDSLFIVRDEVLKDEQIAAEVQSNFSFLSPQKKLILVTVHRRESFGAPMERILTAVRELSQREDVEVLIPLHMNPEVRKAAEATLQDAVWATPNSKPGSSKIWMVEPLEYLSFVTAMMKSHFIISDSGGVQEEAPSLGKPVLVARETTERPEAIHAGTSKLVGSDKEKILTEATALLDSPHKYQQMAQAKNPYGDGSACQQILDRIFAEGAR